MKRTLRRVPKISVVLGACTLVARVATSPIHHGRRSQAHRVFRGLAATTLAAGVFSVVVATGVVISPLPTAALGAGTVGYVTNFASNSVSPIDVATSTAGAPITAGSGPYGIAITPDGKTAYVADYGGTTVTPITISTNTAGTPITVGSAPVGIAITPDGKTAYVTNYGGSTVTPITIATNTAGTPITVGVNPEDIAITPDGKTAYVANFIDPAAHGTVTPITIATNTAGTSIAVGNHPTGIAITADGTTAYVTNYGGSTVTPITIATNTAGAPITVGSEPGGVAFTPDQAPVASVSVTPAAAGSPTSFDASASTSSSSPIASYRWSFGDGSSAITATPTTTHTYLSGGTITASVTETDAAGTSTTQVFTGQTVSRNGGAQATASATFVVSSCAIGTTSCDATVASKTQNVSVDGTKSAATKATVTLSVSPQVLKFPGYPSIAPTATLIDKGLTGSVDVTNTVHGLPSVAGIQIIFQPVGVSPPPPVLLKRCSLTFPPNPCYFSIAESAGSITASLRFPTGDPKWRVASKLPVITSFSPISGLPGKVVAITGTNLSEVTSVLFGNVAAKIDTRALTKLTVTVPALARTGPITLKSLAGTVISTKTFTVT